MSAVDDVYAYLEDQGIAGGSTEWDLSRRREMDSPVADQLVVVSEDASQTEPEMPASSGIGDSAEFDIGVHITVRGEAWDGDSSAAKALEIHTALHGLLDTEIGSTTYIRVKARTAEPVFIGFSDNGRPSHTVAFSLLANQ